MASGLPDADEYIRRIGEIVGLDFTDTQTGELNLSWDNRREGDLLIARLDVMRHKLQKLRTEIAEVIEDVPFLHPSPHAIISGRTRAIFLAENVVVRRRVETLIETLASAQETIKLSPSYQSGETEAVADEQSTRFFMFENEEVKGPYTLRELLAFEEAGTITWFTPCCVEGTEAWLPLNELYLG